MSIRDEFGRRVSDDELCAEVRQAVEGGDEDALRRLGFGGFGGYVQRLSEIMSDSVTDGLDLSADDFGAIMGEVASPARYAHHLVNEAGTAIQSAKDKPLGIHIKPAEPDFDDDALCGTVGKAASMNDPERAVETLADGLGYAVKKAGNDFIKANAEQRSRAGFEVKVKRSGSTKCCPWCAARIGSWAIANAPDGVFGCHANCSCTVEYTSSTGAKTSASGANLHRYGSGAFVEADYQPPHVMSSEEAREKGGFDEPKRLTKNPVESQPHRLTGAANGGIISALSIDNFREADPEGKISEECFDTIVETLKAQKQLYGYNSVRVVDIPPDENNRYEVMRTNAIATPRYPIVILELNRRFFGGRSKAEIDEYIRLQHYSAANSLEEAIIHECGHLKVIGDKSYSEYEAIDKELKGKAFTAPIKGRKDGKSLRDIAAEISPYAQKDGLECIAESEIILSRGETLNEDLQKLYDKYAK